METFNVEEISKASKNLQEYFKTHDAIYVAEDAVFTNMTTGEDVIGRKAISDMLYYVYHIAFDAKANITNTIVTDKHALLEADFVGKHIGEFAGIQATGKQVNAPLCISYDLNEEALIQKARIYMLTDVIMKQLKTN